MNTVTHTSDCPGDRPSSWREVTEDGTFQVDRCRNCGAEARNAIDPDALEFEQWKADKAAREAATVVQVGAATEETLTNG